MSNKMSAVAIKLPLARDSFLKLTLKTVYCTTSHYCKKKGQGRLQMQLFSSRDRCRSFRFPYLLYGYGNWKFFCAEINSSEFPQVLKLEPREEITRQKLFANLEVHNEWFSSL